MDSTSVTAILSVVSTTVATVGTITAGAIGFFLVAKVVKWIRK